MRIFPDCGGLKNSYHHLTSLSTKLNQQRKNDNEGYCDITLTCSGTRFPAHKNILSAASPYFECLLGGQFAERKQNEIDLTESIADPETLECILVFIYTGKLLIQGNNFRELLGASSLLLLNDATELLAEYLKNSLVITNCLDIFELSLKYSLGNISELCLHIIQARMHDYFCHGSKMLVVSPEVFVHLCNKNIFIHTSKEDTINVIKEYVESLKAGDTEVSQGVVQDLYHIAERHRVPNIHKLFESWLVDDKDKAIVQSAPHLDDVNKNEDPAEEILVIKFEEGKDIINLIGWLVNASKWIKLASVNLTTLGCSQLRLFVGFAHDSMAFEIPSGMILIPVHGGQSQKIRKGCKSCFIDAYADIDDLDDRCPHFYFTAWNTLFGILPHTEIVHCADPCRFYVYDSDEESEKTIVVGFKIKQYSTERNKWVKAATLDIPSDYFFNDDDDCRQLRFMRFQVSINDKQIFLAMNDIRKRYITVMQLTPGDNGKLESHKIFHEKIRNVHIEARGLAKSTDMKLRFQEISSPENTSPSCIGGITELDLVTKQIEKLTPSVGTFSFPEIECEKYRTVDHKYFYCFKTLIPSRKNGMLYYINSVTHYVTVMWSFDPVKNDWKSLPGPPQDAQIDGADIHLVPAELLPQLQVFSQAIFEDKHENASSGPFGAGLGFFAHSPDDSNDDSDSD